MQISKSIRVEVTHDSHLYVGTEWSLFAVYPTAHEAHQAVDRALRDHFYIHARLIEETIFATD
jgi:hypothetical protein